MTDVKVEQCDVDRARSHEPNGVDYFASNGMVEKHWLVMLIAETRQAAEKAQQEAVEEAYEEELRAANEHFREGVISYDVLKAAVNTAARMRDAASRRQGHE